MGIDLKPNRWLGITRDDVREQRRAIRNEFGQQLFRVQMGLMPNNYMYVAKFHDTICVLHVFTKKSQKTTKTDIDIAKKRYREARDG